TARKLGPEGWSSPLYMVMVYSFINRKYEAAIPLLDQIIQVNPKDWYAWSLRGAVKYISGKIDDSKADLDQAIALGPDANIPYALAVNIAIRQGRITDAKNLLKVMQAKFPDPAFTQRSFTIAFGDPSTSNMGWALTISTASNLFLGQFDKVIEDADLAIKLDP